MHIEKKSFDLHHGNIETSHELRMCVSKCVYHLHVSVHVQRETERGVEGRESLRGSRERGRTSERERERERERDAHAHARTHLQIGTGIEIHLHVHI